MNKQQLKQLIDNDITTNGQNEITGAKLNGVLNEMVDNLGIVDEVAVGSTTTGAAGTGASVTNSGTPENVVLDFTIPKGDPGNDAVNPFKGWYGSAADLPDDPSVGDYAYVKGANPSDPAAIYECTIAGTWSDSGRTADTSNVQTFATGEEVNNTPIDDTHLVSPPAGALAKAADVMDMKTMLQEDKNCPFFENGYIKWASGGNGTSDSYHRSDYISVAGYTKIVYSLGNIGAIAASVAFYDADMNYLQAVSVEGTGSAISGTIDLQDPQYTNVAFFRFCEDITATGSSVVLKNEDSAFSRISALENEVDAVEDRATALEVEMGQVLSVDRTVNLPDDGYVRYSDGINVGSSSSYKRTSEFVAIDRVKYTNLRYVLGGSINTVAAIIAFYDSDKNYMQSISVQGNNTVQTGEIDLTAVQYAQAAYVKFCKAAAQEDSVVFYNPNTLSSQVEDLDERVAALEDSQVSGKNVKILIFGDSITDDMTLDVNDVTNCSENCEFRTADYVDGQGQTVVYKKWPQLIAEYFATNEVRNYARSGATYKDQPSYTSGPNRRRSLSYQITVAENDLTNPNGVFPTVGNYNPDIVIFALGTNDGDPNDTFDSAVAKIVYNTSGGDAVSVNVSSTLAAMDRSKFNEAVLYAFLKVKSMFPTALCLCVLPIQRWSNTAVMGNLHNGLKAMADYFSIPVIDGAYDMGVTKMLEASGDFGELLKDGLHPNEKGQNVYARMMASEIKRRFIDMSSWNS